MPSNSDNSPHTSKPTYRTSLTYTIAELETQALSNLNGAFPTGVTVPVDVDFLAESHLDLQILAVPGLKSLYGVFGVFRKWPKGHFDLVIDQDIMDRKINLYRFTIGEEIGHYVLHRHHFAMAETIESACDVYEKLCKDHPGIERNAKWFSSAILMPRSHIETLAAHYYHLMTEAAGFGDPDGVIRALTSKLAREFCVSGEAMKYRLADPPCHVSDAVRVALAQNRTNLW